MATLPQQNPQLQGGVRYQAEKPALPPIRFKDVIEQDPKGYASLTDDEKIQVAKDFFRERVTTQPGYKDLNLGEKQQVFTDFATQYGLPLDRATNLIDTIDPTDNPVETGLRDINRGLMNFGLAAGSVMDPFTKAMTFGLADNKDQTLDAARLYGADPNMINLYQNPALNLTGDLLGTVNPIGLTESLGVGAAKRVFPIVSNAAKSLPKLGGDILRGAGRGGVGFGLYEGIRQPIESIRQNGFNLPTTLSAAVQGMGEGALVGGAFGAATPLISRGVKSTVGLFKPQEARPIGLSQVERQAMQQKPAGNVVSVSDLLRRAQPEVKQTSVGDVLLKGRVEATAPPEANPRTMEQMLAKDQVVDVQARPVKSDVELQAQVETIYAGLRANNVNTRLESQQFLDAMKKLAKDKVGRTGKVRRPGDPSAKRFLAMLDIYGESQKKQGGKTMQAMLEEEQNLRIKGAISKLTQPQVTPEEAKALKQDILARYGPEIKKLKAKEEELKARVGKLVQEQNARIKAAVAKQTQPRVNPDESKQLRDDILARYRPMVEAEEKRRVAQSEKIKASVRQLTEDKVAPDEKAGIRKQFLEKYPPNKADQATQDNIKDVLGTQYNFETGIGMQRKVSKRQFKLADIKADIAQYSAKVQQWAKVIDEAMRKDLKIKIDYVAEASGHTSTFRNKEISPIAWVKTNEGKVAFQAYNPDGHLTFYHLDDVAASGSRLIGQPELLAKTKAFRGTQANVYLGAREYKLKDILSRPPRQNPVKDSKLAGEVEKLQALVERLNAGEGVPIKDVLHAAKQSGKMRQYLKKQAKGELKAEDAKDLAKGIKNSSKKSKDKLSKDLECKKK